MPAPDGSWTSPAESAIVGIVGLVLQPSLAFLWAFLILFGITTVPERVVLQLSEGPTQDPQVPGIFAVPSSPE